MVFMVLGLFVFVPFMIMRARKQGKQAREYFPEFERKTGLQPNGSAGYAGQYRGFQTTMDFGMGMNYGKLIMRAPTRGLGSLEGRNTFYQKFHIRMKVPGANFPATGIREKVGPIWRTDEWINDMISGQKLELPALDISHNLKSVKIHGQDRAFAEKLASDPELKRLLDTWHYADIRIGGDDVELILDDNMAPATFGARIASPDHLVQALDICATVAQRAQS